MSVHRSDSVWKKSKQKGSNLLVLLCLADRAKHDGYCFPGVEDIAKRTKLSGRQIKRIISDLEVKKELFVLRQQGKVNKYMIPHGLDKVEFAVILGRRFGFAPKKTLEIIKGLNPDIFQVNEQQTQKVQGGDKMSPVWGDKMSPDTRDIFGHSGDMGVLGVGTWESPEPLINQDESSIIATDEISMVFWSESKIPPPAFGGRGWDDWLEGCERLQIMEVTAAEIKGAVGILDSNGYNYKNPGSLINTIVQMRQNEKTKIKKENKNENDQKLSGDFVS